MDTKTLILELNGGSARKVVIPLEWVITFGPIGVGSRNDGNSTNVLRLYSDKQKSQLKAVFRNILAFHEEGIEILEKVVKKKSKTFNRRGGNGEEAYAAEIRKTAWRNPYADEPEAEQDDFDIDETALRLGAPNAEEGVPF